MYSSRVEYYKQLKDEFQGAVIAYITGDRPGFETRIAQDVIDLFIAQLDKIGPVERIVLYLYTRGGDTSAAWNIVNLLRMYCEDLLVVVPHKAHSANYFISTRSHSNPPTYRLSCGSKSCRYTSSHRRWSV